MPRLLAAASFCLILIALNAPVAVAEWDVDHLEENLTFLAENLSPRKNESSRETIRRYLVDGFFKKHLRTYKKRPIYWMFSSGRQKAFRCLVYLHRYNEGTLARMRTEYVIPLQNKIASRIDQLEGDIASATSTSHRRKLVRCREMIQLPPNLGRQRSRESERPVRKPPHRVGDQRGMNGSFSICAGCHIPRISTSVAASSSGGGDR